MLENYDRTEDYEGYIDHEDNIPPILEWVLEAAEARDRFEAENRLYFTSVSWPHTWHRIMDLGESIMTKQELELKRALRESFYKRDQLSNELWRTCQDYMDVIGGSKRKFGPYYVRSGRPLVQGVEPDREHVVFWTPFLMIHKKEAEDEQE